MQNYLSQSNKYSKVLLLTNMNISISIQSRIKHHRTKWILIVTGDDIFSKKGLCKACGFRFDSKSKTWYKAIEQRAV